MLFAAGGDVAANAGEDVRALKGAEAAGVLLPVFLHAVVLLGLIVGKGDVGKDREGQHRFFKVFEAVEQVGGFALRPAALTPGMAAAAFLQNGAILGQELIKCPLVQGALGLASQQAVEQEAAQFLCPGFMVLFREELEFAQVVLIAERVQGILVGKVGRPVIVDQPVVAAGQNV